MLLYVCRSPASWLTDLVKTAGTMFPFEKENSPLKQTIFPYKEVDASLKQTTFPHKNGDASLKQTTFPYGSRHVQMNHWTLL